ncbi:MAG TPA: phasin family protein [Rhodoblastus sp.]|nr:phasin family protein [Rhodoblastus sp.]
MTYVQTFDTSAFNLSGLMDRTSEMASKAQEVGAEMVSLSVKNFESATKAGRDLAGARDFGEAARIQADYMKNVIAAFADHSGKIAEIVMAACNQAGADARKAAEKAVDTTQSVAQNAVSETARGFEAARKVGV